MSVRDLANAFHTSIQAAKGLPDRQLRQKSLLFALMARPYHLMNAMLYGPPYHKQQQKWFALFLGLYPRKNDKMWRIAYRCAYTLQKVHRRSALSFDTNFTAQHRHTYAIQVT
jgi:hypothetical protein